MPNVSSVRPLRAVPLLVLAGLVACGDPTKPVNKNAAAAVAVTAGSDQVGMPGATLGAPVEVLVTNAQGTPLANTSVSFNVVTGGGNVANATSTTVTTDADGKAQMNWVLGPGSVRQYLEAKAGNASARIRAVVDTTRLAYLSVADTAAVGDTIRVWAAVGLAAVPGEAWGASVNVIGWGDTTLVKNTERRTVADGATKTFAHTATSKNSVTLAASLPSNTTTNVDGGPRMFAIKFVARTAARGKDIRFTLVNTALIGARTFTDLHTSIGSVGATVHVK